MNGQYIVSRAQYIQAFSSDVHGFENLSLGVIVAGRSGGVPCGRRTPVSRSIRPGDLFSV